MVKGRFYVFYLPIERFLSKNDRKLKRQSVKNSKRIKTKNGVYDINLDTIN